LSAPHGRRRCGGFPALGCLIRGCRLSHLCSLYMSGWFQSLYPLHTHFQLQLSGLILVNAALDMLIWVMALLILTPFAVGIYCYWVEDQGWGCSCCGETCDISVAGNFCWLST
jgi:hypothetical protein